MSVDRVNGLAVVGTLLVGLALAGVVGETTPDRVPVDSGPDLGDAPEIVTDSEGRPAVADSRGVLVPLAPYKRIVAAGTVASQVALAVLEPDRVVAWSRFAARNSLTPWSYSGKPMVSSERDLERVLGLQPDLVLYNRVGTLDSGVDRLREAGIPIFDLGPMLGVSSLIGDLRTVATLAQVPERGDQIARTWLARLERLASHIPEDQRPRALYLGLHGGKVFGGTRGSSYYDLLRYAGLVDVAAAEYTGWPAYDAEQVLALDPDLIVTQSETVDTVCDKVGLEQLRACRGVGGARIVGVPAAVLVDPGFGVLDSAELLHEAVFGSRGATTLKPRITPLR